LAEPRTARYTDAVPAKKTLRGSKVVNAKKRGPRKKNEDVALDARSGRIAYAVLSFAGFLGMADRYFAIPWNAIHFD
jgi:PRC-barrel domain